MNITKIAIKNNVFTTAILFVVLFMGISTFNSMPRDDMPPFLVRFVSIVTTFPGASPERVENLISDKIEKVVQEVSEVDFITSESRNGISIVGVSIKESESNLRPIFDKIRRKIEDMKNQLPDGSTVTVKDEFSDVFGIIIGLTAEGYSDTEIKEIAEDIRDGLIKLPNTAKVEIAGIQAERIFVEFNDTRLAEFGLTKQKLQGIISATNIIFPGGDVKVGSERIILEPTGSFDSLEDLKSIIISSTGGEIIRLGDITRVYRGYIDPRQSLVKINGKRGLAIGVNLKRGGNIIQLGEDVDRKLNEYREIHPYGVEIERVASQDYVVDDSVQDFISNLIQAVVVVLAVMLLFLGLRTGMVVASLIPMTMVMTLLIMSVVDVGLNQVSLASLIIALGMLVDNAIVVSESIIVKMEDGAKPLDAAVDASRELMVPLLIASLTTSAAFLAFYLAESVMGEIMGEIFVVVSIALLSSWLLALTMVTMLCVRFLKLKKRQSSVPDIFDKINVYYKEVLVWNLKRPGILIGVILGVFLLSILAMGLLPVTFMPDSERTIVTANVELPLGTTIEKTESGVNQMEQFILDSLRADPDKEGVESWSSYIGQGAPKYDLGYNPPESAPNAAHILMSTTSAGINQWVIDRLDTYIFNHFPEVTAQVSRLAGSGGAADPIAIRISGKEIENLYRISDEIKMQLTRIPGTKNISDNWGMRAKKFVVDIHPTRAQLAGISNQDIAISLQTILSGAQTGTFREGNQSIPIIMRNEQAENLSVEDLESLNIFSQQAGKSVPLKQLADVNVVWQASKILRRDLSKSLTVTSELQAGYTASDVTSKIEPFLKRAQAAWGLGSTYYLGGEAEASAKAMGAVADKLPLAGFVILLLLIGQFNSIKKPAIILATIPLGFIGVVFGLLIAGSYFGFMAFLGIIALAGIVINNGIVLLDRIKIEQEELGKSPQKAIVAAAQQRFRPILLTTATTSLGLLPLWFGGGLMWEPMAIAIIFGLLFATVITLLFVPVLYKVLFRVSYDEF